MKVRVEGGVVLKDVPVDLNIFDVLISFVSVLLFFKPTLKRKGKALLIKQINKQNQSAAMFLQMLQIY
jgi:hypothetical protein